MEIWLLLAIGAQIINAVVAILDKYVVTSKTVLHPFSYAFYVSILSSLSVFVFFFDWVKLPRGIMIPSFDNLVKPDAVLIGFCLLSGFLMFIALVNLYEAFSKTDASDAVPVVTSIAAIGTILFEYIFLHDSFSEDKLIGFFLLALGTVLVSHLKFDKVLILHTMLSGFAFAAYYALTKHIFDLTNFDSGFLYTRIGLVVAALVIITLPRYRRRIFRKLRNRVVPKHKASAYVLGIKMMAGLASIMTLKAVQLGSVAIVQAIGGVQFLFLIIFSALFGRVTHIHFGENGGMLEILHKGIAAAIIAAGLFFIFV